MLREQLWLKHTQVVLHKTSPVENTLWAAYHAAKSNVRQAIYQGGHIWGQALVPAPILPSPTDWGGSGPPIYTNLSGQRSSKHPRSAWSLFCKYQKGCIYKFKYKKPVSNAHHCVLPRSALKTDIICK